MTHPLLLNILGKKNSQWKQLDGHIIRNLIVI